MDRRTSPMLFVALMALARLTAGSGAEPVKVSVYYETLCPDSQRFFSDQLFPVFQELRDIVTLDTNAYGKAVDFMLGGTYVFVCQHGTAECEGNMMVGCAKNLTTEEVFMAFTDCVMEEFTGPAAGPVLL
ncbi:Gamma-interferon-inducible lysosomal thiol reductase [Chionoecetes opilio]|uniref:Gamma-interferon-inducible lysosomal thiol reductase n=1 Tax=Chionoecetes opilio TaxID=41210 RepID=A0A8J4XLE6_CHIOP|nr:Gamma-interferon-inducible lysosomal thiol reductase [Chionoecetes opilio]